MYLFMENNVFIVKIAKLSVPEISLIHKDLFNSLLNELCRLPYVHIETLALRCSKSKIRGETAENSHRIVAHFANENKCLYYLVVA